MKRLDLIRKFFNKTDKGIEIAPYHSPIAPKAQGWNCIVMDVFDEIKLRNLAQNDPNDYVKNKVSNIENVDIVSSATFLYESIESMGELNSFDYIVSSHNFEHLPNPLKFLIDCGKVLKENGFLSMAIPNKKSTFDYSRSLTKTSDFLQRYHSSMHKPDPFSIFDQECQFVDYNNGNPYYKHNPIDVYQKLLTNLHSDEYFDCHVSVFTQYSFLHIISELLLLQLIPLYPISITNNGIEFIVHFKNIGHNNVQKNRNNILNIRNKLINKAFVN